MLKPTVAALVLVSVAAACASKVTQLQTSARLQSSPATPQVVRSRMSARTAAFQQEATRDDAPGVVKPVLMKPLRPTYTPEAMRALVQGSVDLQIVVTPDGSVARQRVVKVTWTGDGYDGTEFTDVTPGLLANALAAVKAAKFAPGTLNGAPAPVMTTVTVTFEFH